MRRSTSKAVLLVYALDFLWVCWPILWVEFLVSTLLDLWKHIDNLKHLRRQGMLHKYGHPPKKSTVNSYAIFSGVTSISVSMYPKKELGGESGRGKSAYVSSVWHRSIEQMGGRGLASQKRWGSGPESP
jgi:hypothetical protein